MDFFEKDASKKDKILDEFLKETSRTPDLNEKILSQTVSPVTSYQSLTSLSRLKVPDLDQQKEIRIAFLANFTTTFTNKIIKTILRSFGFKTSFYEPDYGQLTQEIINQHSGLQKFNTDIILLSPSIDDVLLTINQKYVGQDIKKFAQDCFKKWINFLTKNPNISNTLIFHETFSTFFGKAYRHYKWNEEQYELLVTEFNQLLVSYKSFRLKTFNIQNRINLIGKNNWYDRKMYNSAKLPFTYSAMSDYCFQFSTLVKNFYGKNKKLLIVDADNTLWGGSAGDIGVNVEYGLETPVGETFEHIQYYIKSLKDHGVVLALCSKNELSTIKNVFNGREDFILKLSDFDEIRVNWDPKPSNILTICNKLNLPLYNSVFWDDSYFERAQVRKFLPDVSVPDFPEDQSEMVNVLKSYNYFSFQKSQDDQLRSKSYYVMRKIDEAKQTADVNMDDFLMSLNMEIEINELNRNSFQRCVQLINKTNQFKLIDSPIDITKLLSFLEEPNNKALTVSLKDKFTQHGIISVFLLSQDKEILLVDNWVLSCRAFGRHVEDYLIQMLKNMVKNLGLKKLKFNFNKTQKNKSVESFLDKISALTGSNVKKYPIHLNNLNKIEKIQNFFTEAKNNDEYTQ